MRKRTAQSLGHAYFLSGDENLAHYFKEIGKNKPLSMKDEADCTIRIRRGDLEALEKLVKANLLFVVSVSLTYYNQGLPLSDLISEGNLGLMRAAKRFDEKKNFKFISYAVWWIRQAILQALAEQSRIVRLPLNRAGSIHKIMQAQIKLEQKFQRPPYPEEVARYLNIHEHDVHHMIQVCSRHASLEAPFRDNTNSSLHNTIFDNQQKGIDETLQHISLRKEIKKSLDILTEREKEVIMLYFGIEEDIPHTLERIGQRFQLTRERVRQIKEKALCKLKKSSIRKKLQIYCEKA